MRTGTEYMRAEARVIRPGCFLFLTSKTPLLHVTDPGRYPKAGSTKHLKPS